MHQEDLTLPIGASLQDNNGDRYIIDDLLGQGGFSAVYLVHARHARNTIFALKETINPASRDRRHLAFEAQVLRRLNHRSLPHVYQIFEDHKLNRLYMLMDYIEGSNLELLRNEQPGGRFSLALAMTLLTPIIDALTYLHNQQPPIIHRDVKPSNIIVPYKARDAVLVDFGLAKEYIEDKTTNVFRFGTPGYAAPEQYGQGTNVRTDIYAIGATLYTLLTGKIPTDALSRTFTDSASDPCLPAHEVCNTISLRVSEVLAKAMNLRSDRRYATIEEFWQELSITAIVRPATGPSTPRSIFSDNPLTLSQADRLIIETAHTPRVARPEPPTTKSDTTTTRGRTNAAVSASSFQARGHRTQPLRAQQASGHQTSWSNSYRARSQPQHHKKRLLLMTIVVVLIAVISSIGVFIIANQQVPFASESSQATSEQSVTTPQTTCDSSFAPATTIATGYPHLAECYAGNIASLQQTTDISLDSYILVITAQKANTVTAQFHTHTLLISLSGKVSPVAVANSSRESNGSYQLALQGNMGNETLVLNAQVNESGDLNNPHFEVRDRAHNKVLNAGDFSSDIYISS